MISQQKRTTLFGTNLDSAALARLDSNNSSSSSRRKTAALQSQETTNSILSALHYQLNERKQMYASASQDYAKSLESALYFKPRTNSSFITNEYQVDQYNNFRKAKTAYEFENVNKKTPSSDYPTTGRMIPDPLYNGHQRPTPEAAHLNALRSSCPMQESYKAADGTKFERYSSNYELVDYPSQHVLHVPGKYHELYRMMLRDDEVPQNIRHQFGSKRTSCLLRDQLKVHDTLNFIQNVGINRKHERSLEPSGNALDKEVKRAMSKASKTSADKLKEYYDLSNCLRSQVCHGFQVPMHREDCSQPSVHNRQVASEHFGNPNNFNSPYRRKKDWLGRWTESNVMRERLLKNMEEMSAERAKKKAELLDNAAD